jgi:hypothetical protein
MIQYFIGVRKIENGYYDIVRFKPSGVCYSKVGPNAKLNDLVKKILELSEGADIIKLITNNEPETKETALDEIEFDNLRKLIEANKGSLEFI